MAFRLFKYMINISDQYLTTHPKAKKLPVVSPLVLYHGAKKYKVSLNLWDLFNDAALAKKLWINDYPIINVNNIPDEQLKEKIWSGVLLFFLKHMHERRLLKRWHEIAGLLPQLAGMTSGYNHIRNLLQYSLPHIDQNDKIELQKILIDSLNKQQGEEIMISIAQAWKEEGIQTGIQIGKAEGKAEGMANLIKMMIRNGNNIEEIAKMTSLSIAEIRGLVSSTNA